MLWIYNIGIVLYGILVRIAAVFNSKARLFIAGRKNIWQQIKSKVKPNDRPIWFHFASLGEFEQGRPVLESIKQIDQSQKIIVTFFSPSGYEIRKNYALADVFYLPLDTKRNAKKFIELVNPKQAIFTKYEFWFHYFEQLHKNQIPLYLISGIFRPNQSFFKWYGGFYRNILKSVTHFFVQNNESVDLLKKIGISEVSLSGDTRFDRVFENSQNPKKLDSIEQFGKNSPVFIAGSTWLPDEKLLLSLIQQNPEWKFIIAPHEISTAHLQEIKNLIPEAVLFSELKYHDGAVDSALPSTRSPEKNQVLVIDNIGMLSSLYQYAKVAYIGGGFGVGIHNTLEAAAFGLPVIFGPKYNKFQEAKDLIKLGAAISISNKEELAKAFNQFKSDDLAGIAARNYVEQQTGATRMILQSLINLN